ncbi:MAG TPA: ferredoxin reductase [Thermoleophilia bacterium]|nr:ferredoxin reductase [Thermoleophilia bacterium]
MARAALRGRLIWRLGAVVGLRQETPHVRTIVLDVPEWPGHRAGQHVDVRLTAEDGYQTERSYSIASPPERERLELTVERLDDGEVSPYLVGELREGDRLELRGPIGGYFVWDAGAATADEPPLLLVAGGSGVVPLMCMLRHRAAIARRPAARLLYSARTLDELIYRDELRELVGAGDGLEVTETLTGAPPPGWTGPTRRIDERMLAEVGWPAAQRPAVFVCGPTALVEAVAGDLVRLGLEPGRIKTERFGPTGGA